MKTEQIILSNTAEIKSLALKSDVDLVNIFASVEFFKHHDFAKEIKAAYPNAVLAGCSTAGEISCEGVSDDHCVITALSFKNTKVKAHISHLEQMEDSQSCGEEIGKALNADDLRAILVFSVGLNINGSALIDGLSAHVGTDVQISGGLAGDSGAFSETFVLSNDGVENNAVIGVGLYGDALKTGFGSFGGWEPFGPTRRITRANNNVLFELDGKPALDIYKKYLGDYAKDLPSSGLLFPFEMLTKDHDKLGLIRTILGVDEENGSLTLAGSVEENDYLRLMHASNASLVDGAEKAATTSAQNFDVSAGGYALLVSCVGRKLVMGDQVDDEIDAVIDELTQNVTIGGFYSYGEISPLRDISDCKLHNQTMTIALISEE